MDNLTDRIQTLSLSLEGMDANTKPAKAVGELANVLIEQAKQVKGDDPTIAAIRPFEFADLAMGSSVVKMSAQDMVAVLKQLEWAL